MNRLSGTNRIVGLLFAAAMALPTLTVADEVVEVVMQTSYGSVRIELYVDEAPITTKNFLRYVDGDHYSGASFYRTVRYSNDNGSPKIEVIQGGIGDTEAPFEPVAHEDTELTGILHRDGVISMARGEVGTANSEFFICIGDQPGLDKGKPRNADEQGFAAFGRVTDGMDVIRRIHQLPSDGPADNAYVEGQIIEEPALIEWIRRAD